ncbi:hypothetical protein GOP47_0012965 [Adiantum capillus-veneris]|uniref:Uncharacterized protein n=1 Tax=Adiantum capillus-veneris TaxID=13818 RepID=A0A9D4URP0_ADICA|nr:hypothetical protein GOP47_0012965 [Adiantum capillus-veneris]
MEASRHRASLSSSSSSQYSSSSSAAKHFSSAAQQGVVTHFAASSDADRQSALSFEPFVKKYAWAAMGIVIAISGSLMLLACSSSSSSSSKQAKRNASRGATSTSRAHHYSQRAITPMNIIRAFHSQGTNTEAELIVEDAMAASAESKEAKKVITASSNVIIDADVCSPVPELIIRDTSESTFASGQLHPPSLIDTETLDRSAPLTIFSSLTCPVPAETIRRPVSWSEPYVQKEDFESLSSYGGHPNLALEPLKPTSHISSSPSTTTKRKNIPILGPSSKTADKSIHVLAPTSKSSDKSSSSYPYTSLASSSKGPHQYISYKLPPLSWTQVRIDLFLLISILSLIFFYLYLKRDIHKPVEIQPVKVPFPILRLFP